MFEEKEGVNILKKEITLDTNDQTYGSNGAPVMMVNEKYYIQNTGSDTTIRALRLNTNQSALIRLSKQYSLFQTEYGYSIKVKGKENKLTSDIIKFTAEDIHYMDENGKINKKVRLEKLYDNISYEYVKSRSLEKQGDYRDYGLTSDIELYIYEVEELNEPIDMGDGTYLHKKFAVYQEEYSEEMPIYLSGDTINYSYQEKEDGSKIRALIRHSEFTSPYNSKGSFIIYSYIPQKFIEDESISITESKVLFSDFIKEYFKDVKTPLTTINIASTNFYHSESNYIKNYYYGENNELPQENEIYDFIDRKLCSIKTVVHNLESTSSEMREGKYSVEDYHYYFSMESDIELKGNGYVTVVEATYPVWGNHDLETIMDKFDTTVNNFNPEDYETGNHYSKAIFYNIIQTNLNRKQDVKMEVYVTINTDLKQLYKSYTINDDNLINNELNGNDFFIVLDRGNYSYHVD